MKPTPPMISGWPVVGNLIEFLRDKMAVIERGYQEHGEIFAFNLAGQNVAMLLGPEHSKLVFDKTDQELSIGEASSFLEPIIGQVGTLGPHENYLKERSVIAPLLGGRYMKGHVDAMVTETKLWMADAGENGSFDINDFSQHITMYVAARALLGDVFRQQLGEEFVEHFHAMANGVDQILPPHLPLPRFRKRDQAHAALKVILGDLIDKRRSNPDEHDDFLQHIVDAGHEDGTAFDREHLIGLLILIIFAGFDTTSSHLAWGLVFLLERPDLLELVIKEVNAVYETTDTLELKHLRDMPHLNYTMMEVERYRPAVQVLMRVVKEDIEVDGYHIPAGWNVMISPEYSHKLERVFSNPDQFDPERFNDERCEHKQHPNTLTGFGGGGHKCWGMKFAYAEMSIIIAMLLHQYKMELSQPVEERWISGMMRPNVQINYKRIEVAVDTTAH